MADLMEFLGQQRDRFLALDEGKLLSWKQECLYARQQIMKNDYTLKVAGSNPNSLQDAILNVAAIGISLNPAESHAYLVPRDNSICLDISYKGLVKLATECGAIKDCKSVLVYEADSFKWRGPYKEPKHEADPFSTERGEVKGAYNIAYLHDGRVMVETMSRADLDKVKRTSKAQNGPWKTWEDQMQLKTVTRRAYKSWPQTGDRKRLDTAVAVMDQSEGIAYTLEQQDEYYSLLRSGNALQFYLFNHTVDETVRVALYNSFADGHKVKDKKRASELEAEGYNAAMQAAVEAQELLDADDQSGYAQLREEFTDEEWCIISGLMPANAEAHQ